ncbi:hypothetical protein CQW23_23023 [Capsicum baccatum]|uniref:Uncharacterized protein n=1 Tax=Capsicum baccatum TaxID=33114 RepID=A0A2G2W2J2_CAPBA|nr:hypothetical protein CQW23_23023 [Capsicum baccatum]
MAHNDIDDVLDHLRRIKGGGDLNSVKIDQIETLEVDLRSLRTFMKYHHIPLLDSLAKIIKEKLRVVFDGIPDVCEVVLMLLESVEGNTNIRFEHSLTNEQTLEINRFIKKLKVVQKKMRFFRYLYVTEINGYVDHEKMEGLET